MHNTKVSLIILDGWGWSEKTKGNAIYHAHIPTFNFLTQNCDASLLTTHGENVGLPKNIMGNSEVGHTTIGAGRVCEQYLQKINRILLNEDSQSTEFSALYKYIRQIKEHNGKIHIAGLFSSGGVHSYVKHITKIAEICLQKKISIILHIFSDGRDTHQKNILHDLQKNALPKNVRIATIIGRYFGMDRDQNWERTQKAYNLIINGVGESFAKIIDIINKNYNNSINDEFFPASKIADYQGFDCEKDGLIFTNFRADRARQIFAAFDDKNFNKFTTKKINNRCLSLTDYDNDFNANYIFNKLLISDTLGKVIADHNLQQARIAETEKFNHVTYFFNGFCKKKFPGEQRFLINSPKIPTFDMQPEMAAEKIANCYVENLDNFDFFLVNFANPDMVGHTGNFHACVQAIETVDRCLQKILYNMKNDPNHFLIVTADHGNAEEMDDLRFRTCHTLNPVPFIIFNAKTSFKLKKFGDLTSIAPTILNIFNIKIPEKMNQNSLIIENIS